MATRRRSHFYREFLTPALHRRFTRAAGVALIICYVEAVLIGEKSSFLWWFPLGFTGIRTLLLYISSLSVFVLRVAQLRLNARNTRSPFESFTTYLVRFDTAQTLAWYLFSAWWFGEIYLWSASDGADLGWMAEGNPWEKKRLNEKPIYLRSLFLMLAILQAALHLYVDYDWIFLPLTGEITGVHQRPLLAVPPVTQLKEAAPSLIRRVIIRSVLIALLGPFVYAIFIRRTAWRWALSCARMFWDMPAAAEMSYIPPYHITLIIRSAVSSAFLVLLWESSNALFSAYVAQEPLTDGALLTDGSNDPNGSLLTGLKSNKDVVKTFAFWELIYISQRFERRRQTLFTDIDRSSGSTWTQIFSIGTATIQDITTRIDEFQNPQARNPPPQQPAALQSLPRLSTPLKHDPILNNGLPPQSRRDMIGSSIGAMAKSYGQSPPRKRPSSSAIQPQAERYLSAARNKLLTQGQQETFAPSNLKARLHRYLVRFLHSPLGAPFRQPRRRRVCAIVLGSPHSQFLPIVDAIDALSHLAIASLTEDRYGRVAPDIPVLIRTYIRTAKTLDAFQRDLPPHWTDVGPQEAEKERKVDEVDVVLRALREGLVTVLQGFEPYLKDIGMSGTEIKDARMVAEMESGAN